MKTKLPSKLLVDFSMDVVYARVDEHTHGEKRTEDSLGVETWI